MKVLRATVQRSLPLMCILLVLSTSACINESRENDGPKVFRPGSVSSAQPEFALSFDTIGTAYFNRVIPDQPIQIWVSEGDQAIARKISFSDTRYKDVDPHISPIGDRLYFSSDRPRPDSKTDSPSRDLNTWFVEKINGEWGAPQYAGTALSTSADEVFVSEDVHGNLVFARFGEGKGRARPSSVLMATRSQDGFSEPVRLPLDATGVRITNPAISPDGRLLVVAGSEGPDQGPQLYVSRRSDAGVWSRLSAIGPPVQEPASGQFAPAFSQDGRLFFFTSDRSGNRDIWVYPVDALLQLIE